MWDTSGENKGERFLRPSPGEVRRRAGGFSLTPGAGRRFALRAVASAAVIGAAFLTRHFLVTTPRLAVTSVIFHGNDRVAPERLAAFRRELLGKNLLALDLARIEKHLVAASPWLQAVTVHRSLPGRIEFDLVEHEPVARLESAGALVASDASLLPATPSRPSDAALPVLLASPGKRPGPQVLGRAVELTRILAQGAEPIAPRVTGIDVSDPDDIVVHLSDATYAVHLGGGDVVSELNRFLNVEPVLRTRYQGLLSIDLRFRDRVVVAKVQAARAVAGGG